MFALSGVKEWHDKGYEGENINIMISEPNKTNYHATSVEELVKMYARKSKIFMYEYESFGERAMIDFAIENNIHIINTSYGVNYGEHVREIAKREYKRALDHGIIIVKSAGNDGEGGTSDNGKVDERIINVGMITDKLEIIKESSYDSIGTVDCMGLVGHRLKDGTVLWGSSEATPYVTGLLAVLLSKEKMTVNQVNQYIAKHSMDVGEVGKDNKTGWGVFRLPSFINPLSVRMLNKGKEIFVHKDFVKDGFIKGYTV